MNLHAKLLQRAAEFELKSPAVLVIGEVVFMQVRDACLDAAGRYVNPDAYHPIARLHADNYITSDRQFEMPSPSLASVLDRLKVRA